MGLPEASSPPAGSLCTPDAPGRPWHPLTLKPSQLTVAEGDTATFTCSFSNKSDRFMLNWYRVSPQNQMHKLAAFPADSPQPSRDGRFHVTQLPNGRDFHMSVLAARRNDSGVYFCGAISLFPEAHIKESPRAELTVTGAGGAPPSLCGGERAATAPRERQVCAHLGAAAQPEAGLQRKRSDPVSPSLTLCPFASPERVLETPTERPSPQPRSSGQVQGLVIGVTSVLVGVLLLLLLTWVLASAFPRAVRGNYGPARPSPHPSSPVPHCPPQ